MKALKILSISIILICLTISCQSETDTTTHTITNSTNNLESTLPAQELPAEQANAAANCPQVTQFTTFYVETHTNSSAFFSVAHCFDYRQKGYRIDGIIVSIQKSNGNWHTLERSNGINNSFWWNETYIEGTIRSPDFKNRPVKIIIFARRSI